MKRKPNTKRSYLSFFGSTFACILATVCAAGLLACCGFYQYDMAIAETDALNRLNSLQEWLSDPENEDATPTQLQFRLAIKGSQEDEGIDSGLILCDKKSGMIYDDHMIVWVAVKIQEKSTDLISAVQEAAETADFLDSFDENGNFFHSYLLDDPDLNAQIIRLGKQHPLCYCNVEADEVCVRDDQVILVNGKIELYSRLNDELCFTYPIENKPIPEGYVRFVRKDAQASSADALTVDTLFVVHVGTAPGSPALEAAYRFMDWNSSRGMQHQIPDEGIDGIPVIRSLVLCDSREVRDASGEERYLIYSVTYYQFLRSHAGHFLLIGIILLGLITIFSVLIGRIRYMQYSKDYDMNEYRRRLTASLAHDLKSPLMVISGCAENLRENVHTEKRESYADAILQNTKYMDRLIADVLDLAQLEQGTALRKESCDLVRIAETCVSHYAAQAEKKRLTISIEGSCEASADPRMLSQAVGNLICNAVQYTPEDGCIEIRGADKTLCISNDTAETVEHPERLTEPFVKGDAVRTGRMGSGMGLSIVRQICEMHKFRLLISAEDHKLSVTVQV